MKLLKPILITVAILGIAGFLFWKFYINKDIANVSGSKADYTINASQLINEALANTAATNTKYANKLIVVDGKINLINATDSSSVISLGDSTTSTIICQVDARNNAGAKNLKEGAVVKIKGRFTGINDNRDPDPLLDLGITVELKDCSIEK
jgi:hypothetical protein